MEDEYFVRELMVDVLTEAGFQVDEAETADEGAKLIDADGYALILTDINVPGHLDGIDLATHAQGRKPGIPVIFVSGRPDSLARARSSGARSTVIGKPCSPEAIVRAVRALVSASEG